MQQSEFPRAYIKTLRFKNGKEIELKNNSVVVFVGPNNVGKSQVLNDIYHLCSSTKANTLPVVLENLEMTKEKSDGIERYFHEVTKYDNINGDESFSWNSHCVDLSDIKDFNSSWLGHLAPFFISFQNTYSLLSRVFSSKEQRNEKQFVSDPLRESLSVNLHASLSDYFYEAFHVHLQPDINNYEIASLRLGEEPLYSGQSVPLSNVMIEIHRQLEAMPVLRNQGDGMKSYISTIYDLLIPNYSISIIDEPEVFLHPPHARSLGRSIMKISKDNRQVFISTHSSDIIKGMLEFGADRLIVLRLDRKDDNTRVSYLPNDSFSDIWKDPILRHSNIMDSLFHSIVAVCESDGDCKFYSILLSHLLEKHGKYPNVLFVHSDSKQRLRVVVSALKKLNIQYRVIPDVDIFNQKDVIKTLFETCGGIWSDKISNDYQILEQAMPKEPAYLTREEIRTQMEAILNRSQTEDVNQEDLDKLSKLPKQKSKWTNFKQQGIESLSGNSLEAFKSLMAECRNVSIYPVPIGEMESFVPGISKHGPKWVMEVFDKYPNLDDDIYAKSYEFIRSLNFKS